MMKPPFPVGGGDKKIEDSGGDGLKNFRTGGVIDLGGGGAFAGGVSQNGKSIYWSSLRHLEKENLIVFKDGLSTSNLARLDYSKL